MRVDLSSYSNLAIGTAAFCSSYALYLSFSQVRKIMMVAGTALGLLGGVAAVGVCFASVRSARPSPSAAVTVKIPPAGGASDEFVLAASAAPDSPFMDSASYVARFIDNPHVQVAGNYALRAKYFLDTSFTWVQGRLSSGYDALTQREKDLLNNSVTKALILGLIFFKLGR